MHTEWIARRGSILERLKIPFTKFLMVIKLFDLDTSLSESAKQSGLDYSTINHPYLILLHAIVLTDNNNQSFPVR